MKHPNNWKNHFAIIFFHSLHVIYAETGVIFILSHYYNLKVFPGEKCIFHVNIPPEERTALQTPSISWPKILHISPAISIYFGESSRWKWIAESCLNFGDSTNCQSWSPKNNSSYKIFIFDYFWQYDFYPCKIISACMIDRISIIPPRNYLRCSSSPFLYPRFYILACLSHFSSVW